jgi:hypothetical protein
MTQIVMAILANGKPCHGNGDLACFRRELKATKRDVPGFGGRGYL